jgi:hypothetical protein
MNLSNNKKNAKENTLSKFICKGAILRKTRGVRHLHGSIKGSGDNLFQPLTSGLKGLKRLQ